MAPQGRDPDGVSWFGQPPAAPGATPRRTPSGEAGVPPAPQPHSEPPPAAEEAPSSLVRPYAVTRGRTKPQSQLPLEALVSTTVTARNEFGNLTPECQAITDLCRDWRSVAEVSALLRIPLGVARVLVADMADQGLVQIRTSQHSDSRPNVNLLERVLSGLRKL